MHDESRTDARPDEPRALAPSAYPLRVGRHCIMEFHRCEAGILNDRGALEDALRAGVRTGNLTLVQLVVHAFVPHGLTAVAVLQESHLVLHTWPELSFVAADLFTCGGDGDPQGVCAAFVRALRPREYNLRCFEREAMVPAASAAARRDA